MNQIKKNKLKINFFSYDEILKKKNKRKNMLFPDKKICQGRSQKKNKKEKENITINRIFYIQIF